MNTKKGRVKKDMKEDIETGLEISKRAVVNVRKLVANCPQSTDAELRKLLSIQGAILNQVGLELLVAASNSRKKERMMRLGLDALKSSRNALQSAANITIKEKP